MRLGVLAPLLAAFGLGLSSRAAARNYLVLIADDLGTDKVSAYETDLPLDPGGSVARMDAVDDLASAGVRFTQAWASPLCVPTRASVQTGVHPLRHGLGRSLDLSEPGLDPDAWDLLGERFAANGYETGYFGKWQIGNEDAAGDIGYPLTSPYTAAPHPVRSGFATFDGALTGVAAGSGYTDWTRLVWSGDDGLGQVFVEPAHQTEVVTAAASAWIAGRTEPWLAFVAYSAPHGAGSEDGATSWTYELTDPSCFRSPALACLATESCADEARAVYQGLGECLDLHIEALLSSLDPAVLDDTTIVFFSDNGTPGGVLDGDYDLPGRGKGTTYESGIRVPFVIADGATFRTGAAGTIADPGRASSATIHAVDLYGTLLADAFGAYLSPDSRSLVDCLSDPREDCGWGALPGYTESFAYAGRKLASGVAAVRFGALKMQLQYSKPKRCLRQRVVNLDADPLEVLPLSTSTPEAAELRNIFLDLQEDADGWGFGISFCT